MNNTTRILATALLLAAGTTAFAQGKYGATPADSVECVKCLSLYQEFMKQKSYADALGPWRCAMQYCPKASKNMYIDGVRMRKHFIAQEKDDAIKAKLVDSLLMIYDQRIEAFGQAGFVNGRKAMDMLRYAPEKSKEIHGLLEASIAEREVKSEAGVLAAYYQALYNLYQENLATKEQMAEEYVRIMGYIEANLGGASSSEEGDEQGAELFEQARTNVNELFFRVADCNDISGLVGKMLKQRPDDLALKTRLLKVLNTKECTDAPEYQSLAEEIHRADPSSESAYSMGLFLVKKGDLAASMKYMKEAVDLCTDCPDKLKYLLKAGQVASATGNHVQARSYANKLLALDSKSGEALMLIGNAVASQASACQAPDVWGVYWLAYDYYQRAKTVDPSVADKAGERMASMAARFPEQGEAFFHQLSSGQAYQVTCGGLNEATTVRTR